MRIEFKNFYSKIDFTVCVCVCVWGVEGRGCGRWVWSIDLDS